MRQPDFDIEGWALRSGVEAHESAPASFWIPDEPTRTGLHIGDYAKLIFEISVDDADHPVSVERMWVIVREVERGRYFGLLDNEPDAIGANDEFWVGTEIPFGPEHVIDFQPADEESIALARTAPLRCWPRD
ncbi:hypothetical protein [Sphingopyxis sp. PET50]|uniref:hypothetical protein n=1 Tax=Sphingopyxis sp. PET50 TaxID=2976533 RepID=UPI0021B04901|nr:hypothetical protein [Sphingopyxis sp. PET50]